MAPVENGNECRLTFPRAPGQMMMLPRYGQPGCQPQVPPTGGQHLAIEYSTPPRSADQSNASEGVKTPEKAPGNLEPNAPKKARKEDSNIDQMIENMRQAAGRQKREKRKHNSQEDEEDSVTKKQATKKKAPATKAANQGKSTMAAVAAKAPATKATNKAKAVKKSVTDKLPVMEVCLKDFNFPGRIPTKPFNICNVPWLHWTLSPHVGFRKKLFVSPGMLSLRALIGPIGPSGYIGPTGAHFGRGPDWAHRAKCSNNE